MGRGRRMGLPGRGEGGMKTQFQIDEKIPEIFCITVSFW
jgi:hypothetical protein